MVVQYHDGGRCPTSSARNLTEGLKEGGNMSKSRSIFGPLPALVRTLVIVLLAGSQAWATYPGQNGRIAFVGNFTGTWQLYTIKSDGTDLFQVTSLPATEFFPAGWFPNYSPDGQRIAFSHDMTGAIELYVVNADGTGLTQITHDGAENLFPQWSPDGTHILFSAQYIGDRFDYHNLATIRADGTDRQVITHSLFDDIFPEYSVDGKQIVFTSTRGNLVSALWTMDSNGLHKRRITEPPLEAGSADVSPDGHHMVFINQSQTERPDNLIVSKLDGTDRKKVTGRGQFLDPSYSPDGEKIVFSGAAAEGDPFNLYTIRSDGSAPTLLLACPNSCWVPNWASKQ
jgi:Tol biopolymer transport system component